MIKKFVILTFCVLFAYLVFLFLDALTVGVPRPSMNTAKIAPGGWDYNLVRFREVEEYSDLDILFIGSSTCYRGFDTEFFTNYGYNCFNMGSADQSPLNSYYLLKKYYNNLSPDLIVLDISWENVITDGLEGYSGLLVNMPCSKEMLQMALATKQIYAINSYVREFLFSQWLRPLHETEQQDTTNGKYVKGGYVSRVGNQTDDLSVLGIKEVIVNEQQLDYLKDILATYQNQDTKMLLVVQPFPREVIESVANYNEIVSHIQQIANEYGVSYIDYNQQLHLNAQTDFFDRYHLNASGVMQYNAALLKDIRTIFR